jgi:hypothetical protein
MVTNYVQVKEKVAAAQRFSSAPTQQQEMASIGQSTGVHGTRSHWKTRRSAILPLARKMDTISSNEQSPL